MQLSLPNPLKLYRSLIQLYPAGFKREFASEMETVFIGILEDAETRSRSAVFKVLTREFVALPYSILLEHWHLHMAKETKMTEPTQSIQSFSPGKTVSTFQSAPGAWREGVLAGLPYLLWLFARGLPGALVSLGWLEWTSPAVPTLRTVTGFLAAGALVWALIAAWRGKWPIWSASWLPEFAFFLIALLAQVANNLPLSRNILLRNIQLSPGFFLQVLGMLLVGYILYRITRADQVRGLLAALPVALFVWLMNLEFVPEKPESLVLTASLLLAFAVVAYVTRRGDWRVMCWLFLGLNLVWGALYSYVGIYHGGALPYRASGPSMVEVFRNLIPTYLATSSVLLGPLFARVFRRTGLQAGKNGRHGYRIALFGLLLLFAGNLAGFSAGTADDYRMLNPGIYQQAAPLIPIALVIYLGGLWFLYPAALQGAHLRVWQAILLAVLPLGMPLALGLPLILGSTRPVSEIYGVPLIFSQPHDLVMGVGAVWLLLSIWLITSSEKKPNAVLAVPSAA